MVLGMRETQMKELVGRRIVGLSIGDAESVLAFFTDTDTIAYETLGDCCSTSWFADIVGVDALIGATVANVEELPLEDYNTEDGRSRQESDAAYGYKIRTERGYCDIVFRNSSNGYYGGWMELRTKPLPADMKPITDDWQA